VEEEAISHPIGHKKAFEAEEQNSLWGPPQNRKLDGEGAQPAPLQPRYVGKKDGAFILARQQTKSKGWG